MELAGAPLGEDLLGGLGEHLREPREHLLRDPGQRILGVVEDEHGAAGDRGAAGDDGGSAPEWPGRVGTEHCASELVAGCAWLGQWPSAGGGRRADRIK